MNYRSLNPFFTAVCFAFPTLLGSLVSVVWHGGASVALFEVALGRRSLSRDRTMWMIALLFAFYVLWNVLAFAVNFSTLRDATHLLPLLTYLLVPFSYSLWSFARKEDVVETCLLGSAIACYGGLVLALYQFLVYGMRAEGGAGNALVFAQVSAMAGGICLAGALQRATPSRPVLFGAFAAALIAILLSGSRTDWLIVFLDALLVAFVFRSRLRRLVTPKSLVAVLVFIALAAVLTGPVIWSRVDLLFHDWNAVQTHGQYASSLGVRLALWQIGVGLVASHPIIGHGMQHTTELVQHGLSSGYGVEAGYSHFHDGLLTLAVQSGLVGALSILAIFVLAAVAGVRAAATERSEVERMGGAILLLTVVTYMVAGAFNKLLGHDILDTMLVIYLIVGLYLATGTWQRQPHALADRVKAMPAVQMAGTSSPIS